MDKRHAGRVLRPTARDGARGLRRATLVAGTLLGVCLGACRHTGPARGPYTATLAPAHERGAQARAPTLDEQARGLGAGDIEALVAAARATLLASGVMALAAHAEQRAHPPTVPSEDDLLPVGAPDGARLSRATLETLGLGRTTLDQAFDSSLAPEASLRALGQSLPAMLCADADKTPAASAALGAGLAELFADLAADDDWRAAHALPRRADQGLHARQQALARLERTRRVATALIETFAPATAMSGDARSSAPDTPGARGSPNVTPATPEPKPDDPMREVTSLAGLFIGASIHDELERTFGSTWWQSEGAGAALRSSCAKLSGRTTSGLLEVSGGAEHASMLLLTRIAHVLARASEKRER